MAVTTHDLKWRLLIVAAPVIGVAFFVWTVAHGEAGVARSLAARGVLAAVAALGTAVAWWTSRQLRTASAVPVAQAIALAKAGQLAGLVALRGRARALHDAVPLISPEGELCLWFGPVETPAVRESARPFLLVDDSGECIVLPAGAQVTGHGPVPLTAIGSGMAGARSTAAHDTRPVERLLRNGDRIHLVGRLLAVSPAAGAGLAFPVIGAPGAGEHLRIRIGSDQDDYGLYGMLAAVDGLVLVVASTLAAWSMLVSG